MESSPSKIDTNHEIPDKKESKKKKKAGQLGTVALGPETAATERKDETESFWQKLAKPESEVEPKQKKGEKRSEGEAAERDASTEEISAEELSPDEKHFVEKELIQAAIEESEPNEGEDAEALAEEAAVVEFRNKIVEGESSDEAYDSALDLLESLSEIQDDAEDNLEENSTEQVEVDELGRHEFTDDEEITLNSPSEVVDEDPETPSATTPAGSGTSGGSGSGGGRPPAPPVGAGGGGTTPPPPGGGFGRFGAAPIPVIARPAAPNVMPAATAPTAEQYDPGNPAAAALVGGIIGYLIGRRRGRIKTEKKLLPIQKKLEKQVTDLQWDLRTKEASLRQAARDRSYLAKQLARKTTPPELSPATHTVERIKETEPAIATLREEKPRASKSEAYLSAAKRLPEERIGHVLVTAEATKRTTVEKSREQQPAAKTEELKHPKTEAPVVTKHIEHLNRAELMAISDKIIVEGSSLRQIYENRLVGEKGLRRLVAEYLRGGNVKKALRREVMEREIDFERDPVMRDHPTVAVSGGGTKSENPALQRLLQKAEASLPAHDEEVAYYKARAEYEAREKQREQKQQKVLDASLGVTILLLTAIILMLIIDKF